MIPLIQRTAILNVLLHLLSWYELRQCQVLLLLVSIVFLLPEISFDMKDLAHRCAMESDWLSQYVLPTPLLVFWNRRPMTLCKLVYFAWTSCCTSWPQHEVSTSEATFLVSKINHTMTFAFSLLFLSMARFFGISSSISPYMSFIQTKH